MVRADLRRARAWWILEAGGRPERRRRRGNVFLREYDAAGRRVDFHALRATYITMLVKGGATVKQAQELARHSDAALTLNVYTRLGVHDLAGALDVLPEDAPAGAEGEAPALQETGTDGLSPVDARSSSDSSRRSNGGANKRHATQAGARHGDRKAKEGQPASPTKGRPYATQCAGVQPEETTTPGGTRSERRNLL